MLEAARGLGKGFERRVGRPYRADEGTKSADRQGAGLNEGGADDEDDQGACGGDEFDTRGLPRQEDAGRDFRIAGAAAVTAQLRHFPLAGVEGIDERQRVEPLLGERHPAGGCSPRLM